MAVPETIEALASIAEMSIIGIYSHRHVAEAKVKHPRDPNHMRTLYFDIDGTLLDYNCKPLKKLEGGALEQALKSAAIDRLVCVSGRVALVRAAAPGAGVRDHQLSICRVLAGEGDNRDDWWTPNQRHPLFPDLEWCLSRLELCNDPDHRAAEIDVEIDWFYADDWAAEFFSEHFGVARCRQELGRRILQVNPHGDGSDVLTWLGQVNAVSGSR